jgi:glutamate racemase
MNSEHLSAPLGVFDSGVGGLSILKELHHQVPAEHLIYVADQAHVPYGARSLAQVRQFSEGITRFLLSQGAKMIVVACNTASAAALHYLRRVFPETPFVGMEPALKPAAETTRSGVVGVLATPATFQGELYASLVNRYAQDITVLQDTCPGLVAQIEAGEKNGGETRRILEKALEPMLSAGADTLVLGCTHYPFVSELIQQISGPGVRIIDPAPAVARQARRLLQARGWLGEAGGSSTGTRGSVRLFTTGDLDHLRRVLPYFWSGEAESAALHWQGDSLHFFQS